MDICLIQETWVRDDTVKGLSSTNYNIFYKQKESRPKANYTKGDTTVVRVEQREGRFVLVSGYMAHDREVPLESLSPLMATKERLY